MTTNNDSIRSKPETGGGTEPSATTPDETAEANASGAGQNGDEVDSTAQEPDELGTLRAECDKLRDQLLRTAADFDNFRKRSRRDLDEARQRSRSDLIRDFLPVFDGLERARQTAGSASDLASVVEGVRMVLKLFQDSSERIGLVRVPAVGERFDPAVHEAIQQKETDEQPPGTVIAEIAPGYRFGERLVRPATVVVARKPTGAQSDKPGDAGSNGSSPSTQPKETDKTA